MKLSTSDRVRFDQKVDKSGDCWVWTAGTFKGGYGKFWALGKSHYASRIALIMSGTKIPPGMCALHRCDNPGCVRPEHLFVGSNADNTKDMIAKGRKFIPLGMKNPSSRHPFHVVQRARAMVASGETQRSVARRLSVSFATMCNWCKMNKRKYA